MGGNLTALSIKEDISRQSNHPPFSSLFLSWWAPLYSIWNQIWRVLKSGCTQLWVWLEVCPSTRKGAICKSWRDKARNPDGLNEQMHPLQLQLKVTAYEDDLEPVPVLLYHDKSQTTRGLFCSLNQTRRQNGEITRQQRGTNECASRFYDRVTCFIKNLLLFITLSHIKRTVKLQVHKLNVI